MDQVIWDLERLLAMAAGTHAIVTDGVRLALKQWMGLPRDPQNPDPTLYFGLGDPNDRSSQPYAAWKMSNLPSMLSDDGFVIRQLGQQWAVFVFSEWEGWVRPRLAEAHGCTRNEVNVGIFGDLRLIRQDIVHNGAMASSKSTGRCQILRWFQVGHPIAITHKEVADFMAKVPWAELRASPSTSR